MTHCYIDAFHRHKLAAVEAYDAFVVLCGGHAPPRIAGMDTVIRLAWRIECGCTVEEAAAREYMYRWLIAIKPPDQCVPHGRLGHDRYACVSIFGTPHPIGM
jgi:hypothetical protein